MSHDLTWPMLLQGIGRNVVYQVGEQQRGTSPLLRGNISPSQDTVMPENLVSEEYEHTTFTMVEQGLALQTLAQGVQFSLSPFLGEVNDGR